MDHHFRAFSFVDRIVSVEGTNRISGRYTIPPGIDAFPTSLVAEAVGQLAAWLAMATVQFKQRPVAGLAGGVDLGQAVHPGQTIELQAEIETVDHEAVAYHGQALVDGKQAVQLDHCVGPMVAVEDFDDPKALRERYLLLRGAGAVPGAFGGVPVITMQDSGGEPGTSVRGSFQVPASAPLFADHFPRKPVFPGTLLMHLNLQLADRLARELPPQPGAGAWMLNSVSDVKLRTFIPPGQQLECEARLSRRSDGEATVAVETRNDKRVIGGAKVKLVIRPL